MPCREKILSEDYEDIIIEIDTDYGTFLENNKEYCPILTSVNYGIVYKLAKGTLKDRIKDYSYLEVPKLYGLMDLSAIEETGSIALQNIPNEGLKGQGVIIGFIEDGIDVYNDVFRYSNGNTRLIGAWDQTNQSLMPPFDLKYGSYLTTELINDELMKEKSSILESLSNDSSHGTFVAGIAAGNPNTEVGVASAAPFADIAVVKLKPAKRYLREFFVIDNKPVCF